MGAVTSPIRRVDVLGVGISAINLESAVLEIDRWIVEGLRHYVCVTGVHGVMEATRDRELLDIHNRSGLTTPDGMPMVWASRWAGARYVERVYGPDLVTAACTRGASAGWRMFFYGGAPGVADTLVDRLASRHPGIVAAGTISPPYRPMTPDEDQAAVEKINASRPDIVWVGLSTPKQERWMAGHRDLLDAPAIIGVGAAFDMHAGVLPQAPVWVQRSGFEWLYRLAREPRRLWRRYLRNNPRFLLEVMSRPPRLVSDASALTGSTTR